MTLRHKRAFTVVEALIAVAFCGIALLLCVNLYRTFSGATRDQATQQAEQFLGQMGIVEHSTVVCNQMDTDGDGYVSCSYQTGGQVQTIECGHLLPLGCRQPKLSLGNYRAPFGR